MNESWYRSGSVVSRRRFCGSVAGFAVGVICPMRSIDAATTTSADSEFVIINGWVLTRADFAGEGVDN